jgi:inorganic pyrophosphatase
LIDSKKTEVPSVSINSVDMHKEAPLVEVIIEIPRGGFLNQGSTGELDFISPFPCPFNYGSIPTLIGLDGDLLYAVVLAPRIPRGTTVKVIAWGRLE